MYTQMQIQYNTGQQVSQNKTQFQCENNISSNVLSETCSNCMCFIFCTFPAIVPIYSNFQGVNCANMGQHTLDNVSGKYLFTF